MFKEINEATAKPVAWSSYTADMLWTDTYISKQMLSYHLNPEINAASRSFEFIDESVNWLVSEFALNHTSSVIDFGCGPGLYTHRLKKKDIGVVVGVDFSKNSLEYASQQAQESGLDIEYHLENYLNYKDSRQFNLITLVMCDYCALSPLQRSQLLSKFKSLLKSDGVIALDVFTSSRFSNQTESISLAKNYMNSFWSDSDYWCIHSSFSYQQNLLWLDKFVIIERERERTILNWLQHFNIEMLQSEFDNHDLKIKFIYSDLRGRPLVEGDEMGLIIGHK